MNVLLVNEEKDILKAQNEAITSLGHKVYYAENKDEALKIIYGNVIQVVFCNEKLELENGHSLFKKIRSHSFHNYTYLVLVTDGKNKFAHEIANKEGADDFIDSNVTQNIIRSTLKSSERIINYESNLLNRNEKIKKAYKNRNKKIKNAYKKLSYRHNEINQDLMHAAKLQRAMLPQVFSNKNTKVNWYYSPASYISGDTFNYVNLSKDLLFFFSIDVSGHDISSAMLSISLNSSIKQIAYKFRGILESEENIKKIPLNITNYLNKKYNQKDTTDHYFTMISGIIDNQNKKIHYVQAGHPFPILYRSKNKTIESIKTNGFPVGLLDNAIYESSVIDFDKKDRLLIYSDGIFELEEKNTYIDQRWVEKIMKNISEYNFTEGSKLLYRKVNSLSKSVPQKDDISLMLLEFA